MENSMDELSDAKNRKYSRSVLILVALVGLIATVGLIKDLASQGIRPFGFVENVIAQIVPGDDTFVSPVNTPLLRKIFDSTDRCRPNGNNPLMTGKGGVNLAVLDNESANTVNNFSHGINDVGEQLNMGYQLAMYTTPDAAPSAAQFIIDTSKNGMIPIVRMCYPGGCDFKVDMPLLRNTDNVSEMSDGVFQSNFASHDIVDFYKAIITELDRRIGGAKVYEQDISNLNGYEFIAMVGPNEPGTAGEMEAFGISNYNDLVKVVNEAAYYLQEERVANGGILYLSPGAFNLSNTSGDDLKEFFGPLELSTGGYRTATQNTTKLRTDYFDYLMGNAYDQYTNPDESQVKLASDYVVNGNGGSEITLEYVSKKYDLPIIMTEIGTFTGSVDLMKQSFRNLCQNDTVQGLLLFRNVEELSALSPEPRPIQLSTDTIRDMTQGCVRKIQFPNCNFDTQLYKTERTLSNTVPLNTSTARSFCSVSDPNYSAKVAATGGSGYRIVCGPAENGRVHCSAGGINTVQIGLPINHFGSNSSFGTRTRSFPSYNVEAHVMKSSDSYDPLNQFAGLVKVGDLNYPMPWLGSAIQNSSETILLNQRNETEFAVPKFSPGTETYSSLADIEGDKDKGISKQISYYTSAINSNGFIPDERTIVAKDEFGNDKVNIDKSLISDLQILRNYNPETFNSIAQFKEYPNSCITGGKYVVNNDDYIYGPEVQVGETRVWEGSGGKMCALVGSRNTRPSPKVETLDKINCEPIPDATYIDIYGTTRSCTGALPVCAYSDDAINNGFCFMDEDIAAQCLTFVPPDTGFRGVRVFIYADTLTDINANIEIPGIYDSIFRLKDLMNEEFRDNNLKVVMGGTYGWEVDVVLTARDGVDHANQVNYKYLTSNEEQNIKNYEGKEVKTTTPNYVVPLFLPTKNISQKVNKSYIKDLEYINQINEIRSAYLGNSSSNLPQTLNSYFSNVTNPFYSPTDSSKPNYDRENILVTDISAQFMSYPLLSCDQVNICKKFGQQDLIAQGIEPAVAEKLCPLPGNTKLNATAQITCITDAVDGRLEDRLDLELCRRGYKIDGTCVNTDLQCLVDDSGISVGTKGEYEFTTAEEKVLYPVSKARAIPSCVEPQSVVSVPVPSDWGLKYFEENNAPISIGNFKLTPDAANSFVSMMTNMRSTNPAAFAQCAVNWGYRSRTVQEREYLEDNNPDGTAKACHSEHQLGTALDFVTNSNTFVGVGSFRNTDCFNWLNENAYKYGYINSYGTSDPANYIAEPWHWRWITPEKAAEFNSKKGEYNNNLLGYLESLGKEVIDGGDTEAPGTLVACPVSAGRCLQGVGGAFSHSGVNRVLNAVDLVGDNRQVIAPFDGVVTRFVENYCINKAFDAGDGFLFKGVVNGKPMELFFYHVQVAGALTIGQRFSVGQVMTQMADVGAITLSGNPVNSLNCKNVQPAGVNVHAHVEIFGGISAANNPETNMNNVLNGFGCKMDTGVASCTPNMDIDYGGGTLQCVNPVTGTPNSTKVYPSFNELVGAVANYVGGQLGTHYPGELLRATVQIETSAADENGKPYTGDPGIIAHATANSVGASGPTQFLANVFMGIVTSETGLMQGCLKEIGLAVPTLDGSSRNILGVALCATAIKHNRNMQYFLPAGTFGSTINSQEDWYDQKFAPNTGRADWGAIFEARGDSRAEGDRYDFRTTPISAIEVTGRRYYGACYPSLAAQDAGGYNYCTNLLNLTKSYDIP